MTTTSTPTGGPLHDPEFADVDTVLAHRAASSADYLAGLITAGILDTAGRPDRLPELLFPDLDPEQVRRVWDAAVTAGFRAGQLAGRVEWEPQALDRTITALTDAGYQSMAGQVARTAGTVQRDHQRAPVAEFGVRGEHW